MSIELILVHCCCWVSSSSILSWSLWAHYRDYKWTAN